MTLCVASQRVFIVVVIVVVVYFVLDSVRKLLDTPSYASANVEVNDKVKVKLYLGLTKHHVMNECWGSGV
jgi:uncharacterized protein HemY